MSKSLAGVMSQLYLIYVPLQLFGNFLRLKRKSRTSLQYFLYVCNGVFYLDI